MEQNKNSYEYQAFIAEFYDYVYTSENRADIDFFVKYAKKAKGDILELGCGTGRVLIPTAEAGCHITGLDFSSFMLEKCKDKIKKQPEKVQARVDLIKADMINFKIKKKFSLITTPFRPFQHLISVEAQKSCLKCIYEHLENKGLLILDLFQPYFPRLYDPKYLEEEEIDTRTLPDKRILRRTSRTIAYHQDQQYKDEEINYYVTYPDGKEKVFKQQFPFRYFFRYEVEHLLNLCGFKVIDLFGDYNKGVFQPDSPEMIFVAQKV